MKRQKLDYIFKTKPFDHQLEAFNRSRDMENYALFMEQGTGKSKVIIDTAAWLYQHGLVDHVIIIAPNGVHRNWIVNEIPAHLPDHIPYKMRFWESKRANTKKFKRRLDEVFENEDDGIIPLRFFCINIDAITVKGAKDFIRKFIAGGRVMAVVDESHMIKNWNIQRSKELFKLRKHVDYRRILTGTPLTQGPGDIFGQFRFLDEDILGYTSFYAFQARYTHMVEDQQINGFPAGYNDMKNAGMKPHEIKQVFLLRGIRDKGGKSRFANIEARNPDGSTQFQHMDELKANMDTHTFRCTKDECLDLPPKLYEVIYTEMSKEQEYCYNTLRDELIVEIDDKQLTASMVMVQMLRLQQILGGFMPTDDGEVIPLPCPRLKTMLAHARELPGKVIIWSRFTAEILAIAEELGDEAVYYYGAVDEDLRQENVKRFQEDPTVKYFVGNAKAGGTGLTLHAATSMMYYSNDFALGTRLQSEDRAHRIGQKHAVTYYDFITPNTMDEKIVKALRDKKQLADEITGDPPKNWL